MLQMLNITSLQIRSYYEGRVLDFFINGISIFLSMCIYIYIYIYTYIYTVYKKSYEVYFMDKLKPLLNKKT